jgi:peptidoglycan/LPS O-acetylase OafA/YrhL
MDRAAVSKPEVESHIATSPPASTILNPSGAHVSRIPALDFTKGLLVLIMVLYHWLNYFVSADGFYYRYLRFLTPSFIFVTGFLISHVYLNRYDIASSKLPRRLIRRGLKLMGIFTSLNAVIILLPSTSHSKTIHGLSVGTFISVYLKGSTSLPFSILIPISYLLLASAGLVIIARYSRYVGPVAGLSCFLFVVIVELYGLNNGYLELFSIGLIGVGLGYIPLDRMDSIVRHPYVLLLAYVGYLYSITIWNEIYLLQIVGVCLSLAVMYALGNAAEQRGRGTRALILLGQYSLVAYISQIVILQALRSGLHHLHLRTDPMLAALIAGVTLTLLSVETVDYLRRRAILFNRLYSAVFS